MVQEEEEQSEEEEEEEEDDNGDREGNGQYFTSHDGPGYSWGLPVSSLQISKNQLSVTRLMHSLVLTASRVSGVVGVREKAVEE